MLELRKLGYIDEQNVTLIKRFIGVNLELLSAFASELVAEKVDVIFADSTNSVQVARQASSSIPIVFAVVSDPVGRGFVASLARPGGNITGTASVNRELAAKRLQLLKEAFPKTLRVGALITDEPQVPPQLEQVRAAANQLGMSIVTTRILKREDFEQGQKFLRSAHVDAIYVIESLANSLNRRLLIEFAEKLRLPALYAQSQIADAGGLFSYGASYEALYRRSAQYIDKILKGAKPANLPVEQPTKFELVLNLKTAKTIGITFPQSILVQADRVIE
jgi:putative ABC transport system substrate-binding protein